MATLAINQNPGLGEISFINEQFFCDHDGALFWPKQNCLIVSDLHLEKGAAMAARGLFAPPYDTQATLDRLQNCIARWNPKMVISLGDSFHREDSADNLPSEHSARISDITQSLDWVWITGNHDPKAPDHLGGRSTQELRIGQITFRHEQQRTDYTGEISGHLHPAAKLVRRGRTLRKRCFASDGKRLIMPAFGAFTGGLDLSHAAFSGLLDNENLQVWMLGRDQVYEICAKYLTTK